MRKVLFVFLTFFIFIGCNSSGVEEALDSIDEALENPDDLLDSTDVERKDIDFSRMGVNAFANEAFAGSICGQYAEILNTLGLRYVRVLFNWDDNVQPTPSSTINFSFYDDILDCIPDGMDALVILTSVPSWMADSANWIEGNPRRTFAERWARRVTRRYRGNPRVRAYQVWNEPNFELRVNEIIQVKESPENFVELVSLSSNLIKDVDPGRTVLNGATSAITQNFPNTLDYNKAMVSAGILNVVDIFAIHYYGTNFERFTLQVKDFLNGLGKPIWITESARTGVNRQLGYAERAWPFLRENVGAIDRIYWYRFAENTPADASFGLRTPEAEFPVSDLYIKLRDR